MNPKLPESKVSVGSRVVPAHITNNLFGHRRFSYSFSETSRKRLLVSGCLLSRLGEPEISKRLLELSLAEITECWPEASRNRAGHWSSLGGLTSPRNVTRGFVCETAHCCSRLLYPCDAPSRLATTRAKSSAPSSPCLCSIRRSPSPARATARWSSESLWLWRSQFGCETTFSLHRSLREVSML